MKKLYHGTISLFDEIDLAAGRGYKDFGKGFYATAVEKHAERMALRNREIWIKRQKALKAKNPSLKMQPAIAYRYNLVYNENTEGLAVKRFLTADTEWLRFIVANRKSRVSAHEYDIVIGPTADAQTTMIINEYMEELEASGFADDVCGKVIAELMPENLPKQYFFGTEKALTTLQFDKIKRQVIS